MATPAHLKMAESALRRHGCAEDKIPGFVTDICAGWDKIYSQVRAKGHELSEWFMFSHFDEMAKRRVETEELKAL